MEFSKLFLGRFIYPFIFGLMMAPVLATAHEEKSIRIVVVGDTGIGERSDQRGFDALQKAMQAQKADAILHLGDFVYQSKLMPKNCPDRFIKKIKSTLVDPYPLRIFVAGDNDLPPKVEKPKASGCWDRIEPMATRYDEIKNADQQPRPREGSIQVGPVLIATGDFFDWIKRKKWLEERVEQARKNHKWFIFAQHVPPVTTAWHKKPNEGFVRDILPLEPDLVLSGNQHSYERFYPMTALTKKGKLTYTKVPDATSYSREAGVTQIVSGGGGAFIKPFADLQGKEKRTAPKKVRKAVAQRRLMLHFLTLDITEHVLKGKVHRVCPPKKMRSDSRWWPSHPMWKKIKMDCEGKPVGVSVVDAFEIHK